MVEDSGVKPVFGPLPENVEVCPRFGKDHRIFLLLNHGKQPVNIQLPHSMRSVLTDKDLLTIHLPARGVALLQDRAF